MPISVSDSVSNANEQIEHAARAIGRSKLRRRVFEAIYTGKKREKTADEIARRLGLGCNQVLNAGKSLVNKHVVEQAGGYGHTSYRKIDFFHAHKRQILALAGNPKKLAAFPTKRNVSVAGPATITIPSRGAKAKQITVDDIESFREARRIRGDSQLPLTVSEGDFKRGIQRILGEPGTFTDWGGEKNDLLTTRLRLEGKRRCAAFAFKGPGTKGTLTPKKMGKNADQIQRLFQSSADVFIVQYWREIDQSVLDQMRPLAIAKSVITGRPVWYGVIDGNDSHRIHAAYHGKFGNQRVRRRP